MADAPFVWGAGGEQLTPEQIASRRKIAEAMMVQGMDSSPIRSPWQGVDRVAKSLVGAWQGRQADDEAAAGRQAAIAGLMSALGGGQTGGAPVAAAAPPAPAVDTSGKIYSNDEPSPLDPPSGDDRVRLAKTILGEAANEPAAGQNAVASVIRTRAVDGGYGGNTPAGVVTAPNQFEPWNTPEGRARMDQAYADPTRRAAAEAAIAAAYGEGGRAPNDPTEGMTHFYSPKGQLAMGRPAPAWAGGDSVTIGGHVFNSPDDKIPAAAVPAQGVGAPGAPLASPGAPGVSPAVATVAQAMPQTAATPAAARPGVAQLMGVMSNPFLPPQLAALAAAQFKPRDEHVQETDAAGNLWDVNRSTGQRTIALKKEAAYDAPARDADGNLVQRDNSGKVTVLSAAEKAPTSVNEYEYYKKNFQPSETRKVPMDYETWATAKARAAATSVTTNVGGGTDKQIFDSFDERAKEARLAAGGLTAIREARSALNGEGGSITGAGADFKLGLQKAAASLGLADPEKIVNTETFRAAIAPQVASVLKSTVGTANISDSDRRFAEKAAGGSIELDKGSINRLLDIMERAGSARLKLHQEQLDVVYPDPVQHKRERALFSVQMPTAPAAPVPVTGKTSTGRTWSVEP